jgi:hypothetical protein
MQCIKQATEPLLEGGPGDEVLGVIGADSQNHVGEITLLDMRDDVIAHLGGNCGIGTGISPGDCLAG